MSIRDLKGRFIKGHSRKHTEDEKQRIKESNLKTYSKIKYRWEGKNNTFYGKQHTQETKDKIGLANKGNKAHWKGGITAKNKLERGRFRRDIQKAVFERDNYTCQLCGIRGGDLQVDHIQSWEEYIELRFSMDNCRTLCTKCHYKLTYRRAMPITTKRWGHNLKHLERMGS